MFRGTRYFALVYFALHFLGPEGYSERLRRRDLTPAERAIYELFIRPIPRYSDGSFSTPLDILEESAREAHWAHTLTAESFSRIAAVYPQLIEMARQGREWRMSLADQVNQRLIDQGITINPPAQVAEEYMAVLRRFRRSRPGQTDPLIAETTAREQVRTNAGYPLDTPIRDWDPHHRHRLLQRTDWLREQTGINRDPLLPRNVFEAWITATRRRLEREHSAIRDERDFGAGLEHYLPGHRDLRRSAISQCLDFLRTLDPRSEGAQQEMLERLQEIQRNHNRELHNLETNFFGEQPERLGVYFTTDNNPQLQWLIDLHSYFFSELWIDKPFYFFSDELRFLLETRYPRRRWFHRGAPRFRQLQTFFNPLRSRLDAAWDVIDALSWEANLFFSAVFSSVREAPISTAIGTAIVFGAGTLTGAMVGLPPNHSWNPARLVLAPWSTPQQSTSSQSPSPFQAPSRFDNPRNSGTHNRMRQNSDQQNLSHYQIVPLQNQSLRDLPTQFSRAFVEDFFRSNVIQLAEVGERTAAFRIQPPRPFVGTLSVPVADGYDVIPTLRSEDGPVDLDELVIRRTHNGNLLIPLQGHGQVTASFTYYPNSQASENSQLNIPVLTVRERRLMQAQVGKMRDAGMTILATDLEDLLKKDSINVADLESTFRKQKYSHEAGEKHPGQWENIYDAYEDFVKNGEIQAECDVINDIFKEFLEAVLLDHPELRVEAEVLLVRDPESDRFEGHQRLRLRDRQNRSLVLDATSSEEIERLFPSPQHPQIGNADSHSPTRLHVPFVPDLFHRFRFRDELVLEEDDTRRPGQENDDRSTEENQERMPANEQERESSRQPSQPRHSERPVSTVTEQTEQRLQQAIEQERQERMQRNQQRRRQLEELAQRVSSFSDGVEQVGIHQAAQNADTPQQLAGRLAGAIAAYVEGDSSPILSLFRNLEVNVDPDALGSAIDSAKEVIISRARNVRENRDAPNIALTVDYSNYATTMSMRPVNRLLDYLASQSWSALESEDPQTIRNWILSCDSAYENF